MTPLTCHPDPGGLGSLVFFDVSDHGWLIKRRLTVRFPADPSRRVSGARMMTLLILSHTFHDPLSEAAEYLIAAAPKAGWRVSRFDALHCTALTRAVWV